MYTKGFHILYYMKDLSQTYKSVLLIFCWSIHGMRSLKKIYIYVCM